MARYRLSRLARSDLANILAASVSRWGIPAMDRYSLLLMAAMSKAAADPYGRATRDRSEIAPRLRSLHLRFAVSKTQGAKVGAPVHTVYCRVTGPQQIEILRVLHDRMQPSQHLDQE
jgi:toxin ParE1/3/4